MAEPRADLHLPSDLSPAPWQPRVSPSRPCPPKPAAPGGQEIALRRNETPAGLHRRRPGGNPRPRRQLPWSMPARSPSFSRRRLPGGPSRKQRPSPVKSKGLHASGIQGRAQPAGHPGAKRHGQSAGSSPAIFELTVSAGTTRDVARRAVPLKPYGLPVFATASGFGGRRYDGLDRVAAGRGAACAEHANR